MSASTRLVVVLVAAILAPLCPARAGGPSSQEIRASQTVAIHLRRARAALHAGKKHAARRALREAVLVGGAQLDFYSDVRPRPTSVVPALGQPLPPPPAASCSGPFFRIPRWVLVAQVRQGDADGARETARMLSRAPDTLAALCFIARLQAGMTQKASEERNPVFAPLLSPEEEDEEERIAAMRGKDGVRWLTAEEKRRAKDADYTTLLRYTAAPSHAEAIKTLRQALPYAVSLRRRYYSLEYLLQAQKETGDTQGTQATARLLAPRA